MAKKRKKKSSSFKFPSFGKILSAVAVVFFRLIPTVFLASLVFVVVFGVKEILYADPALNVQKITFQPATPLVESYRAWIEKQLLGTNILQAPIKKVSRELERHSEIQSATVSRKLPSEIVISVVERYPACAIQFQTKGPFFITAEDGFILRKEDKLAQPMLQIQFTELVPAQIIAGNKIQSKAFMSSMKFLKDYEQHPAINGEIITQASIDRIGNVSIVLGPGPEVKLGRNPLDQFSKLAKIGPLIATEGRDRMEYIDLRFEDVIIKRKNLPAKKQRLS